MNVVPLFDARLQRYEQAETKTLDWFSSPQRCSIDYGDRVLQDLRLLDALTEQKTALLNCPALSLADVVAKVETLYDGCEVYPNDYSEPVHAAIAALQAGDAEQAQECLERFLALVVADPDWEPDYYEGAAAALADLRRLSA